MEHIQWFIYYFKILGYITRNDFMIIFTMEYIRLLGGSVDTILVAMTSY